MTNTHAEILRVIRAWHPTVSKLELDGLRLEDPDPDVLRSLFRNYRQGAGGIPKGLRLTNLGLCVMRACFKSWRIPLPEGYEVITLHILFLDRICTMPWHVTNRHLTLFEAQLAMRAKLTGDIETLKMCFEPT